MIIEKPQRKTIAIQAPAKPIIEPIDRSNSPATINKPAPSAIIASCDITLKLFRMPSALKPSPAKGFKENSPAGIEKYPSMPKSKSMTPTGPISGLENRALNHFFCSWRSDSCR